MSHRSRARSVTLLTAAALVVSGGPALAVGPPRVLQQPGAPPMVPAAEQVAATAETYPEADTNVYTVSVTRNGVPEERDSFAPDVQEVVDAALDDLKSLGSSPEAPLLVLNPFGTNTTGVHAQFETEGSGTLTYTVSSPGTEDFTRVAKDHDPSAASFEGQLIGVVPGAENTVTTTWQPDDGGPTEFSFTMTAPPSASGDRTTLDRTVVGNAEELTDGLFAVMGLRRHIDYTLLYDNAGVLRAEFDLDGYRTDRLEFYGDTMVTTVGTDKVARIDGLGRVVATHVLAGFEMHHDFDVTDDGKLVILATETAKGSVEDVLVSLDLETGTYEKTVDFTELLADYKSRTQPYGPGFYGPGEVDDWLHLNSVDWSPDGDSVIVSARENSAILKVDDVHGNPTADYIIGQREVWAGTGAEDLLLEKTGDFPDTGGQHSVVRHDDVALADGQYYLTMFDNSFWSMRSRPDYTAPVPVGTSPVATADPSLRSEYRKYLVDENAGTYSEVETVPVPYSAIVSNVQDLGGPLVVNSGQALTFAEYDAQRQVIARFDYALAGTTEDDFAYRVLKYGFDDFWFAAP
ncbi:aryl-sulfate sulfotransferase [Kocuria rosea]|uniref:aryl-sulfate sulfotransferase n=1 Tax=Kocuria rosea TaxID=1275 RepID=UPI00116818BC|nr:aryl-sulfate sulfotransferase [Kocuria rosea]TQN38901.1 arylsulfotransferase ASST [Kocuria rosea]